LISIQQRERERSADISHVKPKEEKKGGKKSQQQQQQQTSRPTNTHTQYNRERQEKRFFGYLNND
jgi:hypothetical protein